VPGTVPGTRARAIGRRHEHVSVRVHASKRGQTPQVRGRIPRSRIDVYFPVLETMT